MNVIKLDEKMTVPAEFIEENKANLSQFMPKSGKTGPYSTHDKLRRRDEVYRLHFEYGYSARKIAELMRINRNTINSDILYWRSKIIHKTNIFNPEHAVLTNLARLEIQRTRLRECLDKIDGFSEQLSLERLIYDLDNKILQIYQKLSESIYHVHKVATVQLNDQMKKQHSDERFCTFFDTLKVSSLAHAKIMKIVKEDRSYRY